MTKLGNQRGLALILFVIIISVISILYMATTWLFANEMKRIQFDIDKTKAHYLAQAGIMKSIYDWFIVVPATHQAARRYSTNSITPVGVNIYKTSMDPAAERLHSNFAYYTKIVFLRHVANANNNAATNLLAATVLASGSVAVGDFVVGAVAMDGVAGFALAAPTVFDNSAAAGAANVYTVAANYIDPAKNNNTGVRTVIFYSLITRPLANPNTITFDWVTNTTAEAMTVAAFGGVSAPDVAAQVNFGTGTALSTPATANTNYANALIYAAYGIEGPTGDGFTATNSFLTQPPTRISNAGATDAGMTINPEYKIVDTTGTWTSDGTIGVSRDWSGACAVFYEGSNWLTSGGRRFQRWWLRNINNGSSIILDKIKVSWAAPAWVTATGYTAGTSYVSFGSDNYVCATNHTSGTFAADLGSGYWTINTSVLNDVWFAGASKWSGSASSGTTVELTNVTIANAGSVGGTDTYLQWDTMPIDPVTVTAQFIFTNTAETLNTATSDPTTHVVTMWDGPQTGAGAVTGNTFSVTASGQVNQSGDNTFKVLKTIKATVAGNVTPAEIIDWQEGDKNIP